MREMQKSPRQPRADVSVGITIEDCRRVTPAGSGATSR